MLLLNYVMINVCEEIEEMPFAWTITNKVSSIIKSENIFNEKKTKKSLYCWRYRYNQVLFYLKKYCN